MGGTTCGPARRCRDSGEGTPDPDILAQGDVRRDAGPWSPRRRSLHWRECDLMTVVWPPVISADQSRLHGGRAERASRKSSFTPNLDLALAWGRPRVVA